MSPATAPHDVPIPAGCVRVYDWDPPEVTGYLNGARYFVCPSRRVELDREDECFEVFIDGTQWDDGRIERGITVHAASDDHISSAQARELAAVLVQAADDVDGWASR